MLRPLNCVPCVSTAQTADVSVLILRQDVLLRGYTAVNLDDGVITDDCGVEEAHRLHQDHRWLVARQLNPAICWWEIESESLAVNF
jgi:hypothetical protein